jgi:hypothetical protein
MRENSKFGIRNPKEIRTAKERCLSEKLRMSGVEALYPSLRIVAVRDGTPSEFRVYRPHTQGRLASSPTLGWRTQSLWDCETHDFEFRASNVIRVSSFEFRISTPCK